MSKGLDALDEEIGKSELLMSVAPIRLITVGGSLAVLLCGNRTSSTDIDCILDPQVAEDSDYAEEWIKVVATAADAVHLDDDWLNSQLSIFVRRDKRKMLFLESVQQDIAIYEGKNLVIYAGRLDWALERKIRRVAYATERQQVKNVDTTDAAAIIKLMVSRDDYATPLSYELIRGLNYNGFDIAPSDDAIREVARYYKEKYGHDGIIE
ncbi:hypothetical protein BM221_006316 [Beauveria bassiana]|uniref:Uncharacterized protein n=1 Tax=Beauveria bassiana TaxID=176275 RepID=A0A2N6NLJ2_BEABA|nr:hypothetical protein BM221_006316 [Beauveria bassiana]